MKGLGTLKSGNIFTRYNIVIMLLSSRSGLPNRWAAKNFGRKYEIAYLTFHSRYSYGRVRSNSVGSSLVDDMSGTYCDFKRMEGGRHNNVNRKLKRHKKIMFSKFSAPPWKVSLRRPTGWEPTLYLIIFMSFFSL